MNKTQAERPPLRPRRRSTLETAALTGIVVLSTLLVVKVARELLTGPAVQATARRPAAPTRPATPPPPPVPREPITIAGAAERGNPAALVAVIEHQEYQCPFCGVFSRDTAPLLDAEYVKTGKVRWVVRHYPLTTIHPRCGEGRRGGGVRRRTGTPVGDAREPLREPAAAG